MWYNSFELWLLFKVSLLLELVNTNSIYYNYYLCQFYLNLLSTIVYAF